MALKLWSHDVETDLVQPGLAAPPLVCSSIADDLGVGILDARDSLPWFRERIARDRLVGLNYAFDLGVMCAADPSLVRLVFDALESKRIHDVGIREALIDIARGALIDKGDEEMGIRYGMRELSKRYFNEDVREEKKGADSWRRRFATLRGVKVEDWPWAARRYVLRDAAKPLEIFRLQEGGPNLHDEYRQVRAAFAFQLMSMWGLRTNRPKVEALEAEVEAEWQATRRELMGAGIFRPDFTQNKKRTAELVKAAYGDATPYTAPSPNFPEGQIATDRDTLLESGDKTLIKLGSSGKNDKRKTLYGPILRKGLDVPWNAQFNVLVATGRKSGNGDQFPKKGGIRECFEPRPGFGFFSVDYEGLELRTMSQRAIWELGFSHMAEVLNAGKNAHVLIAADFMGRTYDEIARLKKEEPISGFYDCAKVYNFSKGGGGGTGTTVYHAREKENIRFCLSTGEATVCGLEKRPAKVRGKQKMICSHCFEIAKRFDAQWFNTWLEQKELKHRATLAVDRGPCDVLIPGVNMIRGRCGFAQWLNNPFQGLGGALAKDWTWRVSKEMHTDPSSPLWGAHLDLMVHDELIGEAPLDRLAEAAERVSEIGEQVEREWLPDLAPACKAEPAISLVMSKQMATVRDSSGRLQLWVPDAPKKAA